MKAILSLLCAIGVSSMFQDNDNRIFDLNPDFDIIGSLPLEVAIMILRLLDAKSLVKAITVRRSWFRIIRSDTILRQRVRDQLRKEREESRGLVMYVPRTVRTGEIYRPVNNVRPAMQFKKVVQVPMRSKTRGQKRKLDGTENPTPKKNSTAKRVNERLR